jgi:6-carboxyhexanoate--CoA ligase
LLFNVKMRASKNMPGQSHPKHISGAERIVRMEKVPRICDELLKRAIGHEKGIPDQINLKVEMLDEADILYTQSLPVLTTLVEDFDQGEALARCILGQAGISQKAIERGRYFLMKGDGKGNGLKGALVLDGERADVLNPDGLGIRATRMDYSEKADAHICSILEERFIAHTRLKEALVLATKVAAAPYAWCELCFSDNPDYHIGYVAVSGVAYFRLPFLKPQGAVGGRVFFVSGHGFDWQTYDDFLRNRPVVVDDISSFLPDIGVYAAKQVYKSMIETRWGCGSNE